jgi:hypothetical protein
LCLRGVVLFYKYVRLANRLHFEFLSINLICHSADSSVKCTFMTNKEDYVVGFKDDRAIKIKNAWQNWQLEDVGFICNSFLKSEFAVLKRNHFLFMEGGLQFSRWETNVRYLYLYILDEAALCKFIQLYNKLGFWRLL